MRWLFLFVLTLNLAYIAWQASLPSPDLYADVPPLKNVSPVVLLSEVRNNEQPDQTAVLAQQESTDNPTLEVAATVEPMASELEIAAITPAKESEVVTESASTIESPDAIAGGAETDQPLLSRSCYTLGPFRDLDVLRGLTREIKSYVVAADFRGREEKEQYLYWVYIKPEKSLEEAIQTGERLKTNKIKDFYVIREGDNVNGVSLGRFRNKDRASRLAKKVAKLGFDVQTDPLYKTYTVYWLDYELADGVSIPEAVFDKYIQSNKTDEVTRSSRECAD